MVPPPLTTKTGARLVVEQGTQLRILDVDSGRLTVLPRFPRYQDVFPSNAEVKIHFPEIAELRIAVEQASIVTSEESRGVDFQFADGILKLTSQAADVGSSHVDLPIAYDGKAVEITFDAPVS